MFIDIENHKFSLYYLIIRPVIQEYISAPFLKSFPMF